MLKVFKKTIMMLVISLVIVGCSSNSNDEVSNGKLQVVTTYSILADIVENIVMDKGDVYSMVPVGVDPHMYEPLPKDVKAVNNADVIFYNGLNLEAGGGWFDSLLEVTDKVDNAFSTTKNVKPFYLSSNAEESDPHAWLDIQNVIIYVNNILEELVLIDPENSDYYIENSKKYISELEELDRYAQSKFSEIPIEKRVLITSEGAFKYFAKAYDFEALYIWEINTDAQGTPDQMARILDIINSNNVKSLFVETSVSPKTMESISKETNIPIHATIFTDSLAKKGEVGDTYLSMMKYNIDMISEGLN